MIPVGIYKPDGSIPEINLHPNPAKNQVMVTSSEIIEQITLYNISGKIIEEISCEEQNISLNTTVIPDGLYLVKIETGTKVSFQKFVIHH